MQVDSLKPGLIISCTKWPLAGSQIKVDIVTFAISYVANQIYLII